MREARVKKTGKIISVEINKNSQPAFETGAKFVYEGSDGNTYLELDFDNIYPNWEERRFELVKIIVQSLYNDPSTIKSGEYFKFLVSQAIEQADIIIEELKVRDNVNG